MEGNCKKSGFFGKEVNIVQLLAIVCERVGNIVGKGENVGNQYFSPPTLFSNT